MKPFAVIPIAALLWVTATSGQTVSSPAAGALSLPPSAVSQSPAALPAAPEAQPSAAKPLTLEQAIAMAEQNSPRLRGAAAATQRAAAAVGTSRAYINPSLEVFQGRQYARPIATPGVPGLLQHYAAYQAIEIPSERRARTRAAELSRLSADFGQKGVTRSVVADVKHAFYDVLRRREELAHQQENLKLVEDLRRRVEVEYRVGEKGRLELTRAEAELGRAGFAVRGAQLELANAIALLRIAIAAPADDALDPRGSLEQRIKLPELTALREEVLRTHPAIAQAAAEVDAAGARLDRERRLRIPQPTAFAEFENQPDLRFWRAGVTVPIPLWDRRRGPIEESKAAINQAQAEAGQRRLELISATERAYEQYQLADQQATSLESGELRAASSAVDAAQAAYRFGERGIVEVLDAQRVLQSVRDDLINAQFARQSALIDLEELGAIVPGGRP
ncbi:outer membrane protein [Terriglobus roseus DSM 18391]|uniref:Outer membrane protein n=1 Tax=Terriglobus roseus (strain DSM 18391 / NRRL B-41598 / KBS 63) TaxID=926566 RepID=I3ZK13_TERRK|nr:TolC family protein [Terriglobus roseus]AFL89581.1 outer membrane protein [Terriglobus roseus DSM 18391]